jgi:hypothetical protein
MPKNHCLGRSIPTQGDTPLLFLKDVIDVSNSGLITVIVMLVVFD